MRNVRCLCASGQESAARKPDFCRVCVVCVSCVEYGACSGGGVQNEQTAASGFRIIIDHSPLREAKRSETA